MQLLKSCIMTSLLIAIALSASSCPVPIPVPCVVLPALQGLWLSDDSNIDVDLHFNADGTFLGNGTYITCCSIRMEATWLACSNEPLEGGELMFVTSYFGHPCCTPPLDPPELRVATYEFVNANTIVITGLFKDLSVTFWRPVISRDGQKNGVPNGI